jgi:flagellar protein FliS
MSPYQQQLGAYQQAVQTVNKSRQIVMLYDGIIRFLSQAREAMEEKRIEDRYNLLSRASQIIFGLQGSLDFDHGKDVAATLYDYYASVDARIMALHTSNSAKDCQLLIDDLKQMRQIWADIDAGKAPSDQTDAANAATQPASAQTIPTGLTLSV